jgi:hypothetical protein
MNEFRFADVLATQPTLTSAVQLQYSTAFFESYLCRTGEATRRARGAELCVIFP